MVGEIIKILPTKKSRNENDYYIRVEFKLENGAWAKTDLVYSFRNFNRWKNLLRVGNVLGGLKMKDEMTVDADSFPRLISGEYVGERNLITVESLGKLGVFG